KLDEGRYDAIILAAAGLRRLGWGKRITAVLPLGQLLPAVGQGALAIVGRARQKARWRALNDPTTEIATKAERALLEALGGGCHVPIGAYARLRQDTLLLDAIVADPKGKSFVRDRLRGDPTRPEKAGRQLARCLLEQGAGEILSDQTS
ncbi:hydroxymethylbilane synthase, partial [Candidatus Sumerlaeota bacterium]